jgi:hypothetical protein
VAVSVLVGFAIEQGRNVVVPRPQLRAQCFGSSTPVFVLALAESLLVVAV